MKKSLAFLAIVLGLTGYFMVACSKDKKKSSASDAGADGGADTSADVQHSDAGEAATVDATLADAADDASASD